MDHFNDDYYRVYKAAFSPKEWPAEKERLIAHYEKKHVSNESFAAFYNAEGDMPGLLACIEKSQNLNQINK